MNTANCGRILACVGFMITLATGQWRAERQCNHKPTQASKDIRLYAFFAVQSVLVISKFFLFAGIKYSKRTDRLVDIKVNIYYLLSSHSTTFGL